MFQLGVRKFQLQLFIIFLLTIIEEIVISVCPIINRLSDHDTQSITSNTITLKLPTKQVVEMRKINKYTNNDFLTKLS
jgi:hypothetical protein